MNPEQPRRPVIQEAVAVLLAHQVPLFDLEDRLRRVLLAAAWLLVSACRNEGLDSAGQPLTGTASVREAIPAEWTVAEDTSAAGEITTLSVQLPTARDIPGLLHDERPRLVLRCLEGRVAAFIDTGSFEAQVRGDSGISSRPVRIDLDAAPACE